MLYYDGEIGGKRMKAVNLKISKKALIFLVSGTLSLTTTGCSKSNKVIPANETVISSNEDELADNITHSNRKVANKEKREEQIEKYSNHQYGFVKNDVNLKKKNNKNSKKIAKLEKYEKVKLIAKIKGCTLVKYNKKEGYIQSKNIKKIDEAFIDIDISEQKLKFYNQKGEVVIKSDIVTGKNSSPTDKGMFDVYQKCTNYTMYAVDKSYKTFVNYVLKFNQGELEYLHDATWRTKFGGNLYKTNGSHGCVNLPYKVAKKLYKKIDVGTPVLVHK